MDVGEAMRRLHEQSWSVGDSVCAGPDGLAWLVMVTKGGATLQADGRTDSEAWRRAVEQAEGMAQAISNGRASRRPGAAN
jgi:hypothetical protein